MTGERLQLEHAAFLKRNGSLLADILSAPGKEDQRRSRGLLEELTILVALGVPSPIVDGRTLRSFDRVFKAHPAASRAAWTARRWRRMLGPRARRDEDAHARLERMHSGLARRHDFPTLSAMKLWGYPKWREWFTKIGADPELAGTTTSLLLDREELPAGAYIRRVYERLGYVFNGQGRPTNRDVLPADVRRLKHLLPSFAATTCRPDVTPGAASCKPCTLNRFCSAFRESIPVADSKGPTFVDLFAGGGGLSLGFTMAGLRLLLAVEMDQHAADTLYLNHAEAPKGVVSLHDVRHLAERADALKPVAGVDIVAGGPPCQPFSMARRHSGADVKHAQRNLFRDYIAVVQALQPKLVVMENVPGLRSAANGRTLPEISRELDQAGFTTTSFILNAADFGVAQNRQRVFIVGASRHHFPDAQASLEKITHAVADHVHKRRRATLRHALSGLPPLRAGEGSQATRNTRKGDRSRYARSLGAGGHIIFNHEARPHNQRDLAIFEGMRWGETADEYETRNPGSIPYQLESFGDKYRKLHPDRPAPTIPAHLRRDANSFIHPFVARGITGREAARMQSFPDDYVFLGGFGPAFTQIGNAVPPRMAEVIGRALAAAMARSP